MSDAGETGAREVLTQSEARGLRLLLLCRTLVLVPVPLWLLLVSAQPSRSLPGVLVVSALVALGVLHLWLLRSGRERPWHRYLLAAFDFALLGLLVVSAPLHAGEGEVPAIILFRAYGVHYLFVLLALSALSLSPRYVLWVGLLATLLLWSVYLEAVIPMEQVLSWSDLQPDATAADYVALVLNPDFIGTGNRVEESIALLFCAAILATAVWRARRLVSQRAAAEAGRRRTLEVFGQYVPQPIAQQLAENPQALAPRTREASILILDIAGFTPLSERHPPEDLMPLLNDFFSAAGEVVNDAGGLVLGYLGDGFLAAFNVAAELPSHAEAALEAGRGIARLIETRRFGGQAFRVRIGIASGAVAAGSVGGAARQSYTVYGATVNLAQRLEAACKSQELGLLASETTWRAAGEPAGWQPVGPLELRGVSRGIVAYTPAR